jgi:hypothetical protein
MVASIPASQLVNVIPGVLGVGGNPLSLNAVILTSNAAVPIGTVMPFSTVADVQAFFGISSTEASIAAVYFAGFDNATSLPGTIYFAQYNTSPVGAYLRGGSQAGVTLAQLQLLSGTLTTVVNGVSSVSLTINLAAASSFTNAAALIQTGIQGGTPSSTATCTYDAQRQAFVISSSTTGVASTIAFATGSLSTGLKLTSATGAVLSQGADDGTPAVVLASVVAQTQNWASFMTSFEPVLAEKLLFADWVTAQNNRYMYVCWDSDITAQSSGASGTFGVLTADFNGVCPVWSTSPRLAAFVCGAAASIDFAATNGRITFAGKGQAGLVAEITNATVANNLQGNGYNFYGSYATANQLFTQFQHGQISGDWLFIDEYVNQIKLNADLQLAGMLLLTQVNSIPYNADGISLQRAAAMDPINVALNNGTIRSGVQLSALQVAAVNSAVGKRVSDTLFQLGWYYDVRDASPAVRAVRGPLPATLYYTSGGSVQQIQLASIAIL